MIFIVILSNPKRHFDKYFDAHVHNLWTWNFKTRKHTISTLIFSCINYKCRNEIFTRICINFVNTLSLTFLPNFLIFIFLCCRLMLIYFFSLVTGHALAMPCKKSDLIWNTEIAVVMFTFLKIVLTSYFREVCKSQDINLMISQFIFLDICFLARKKWQGS